MPKITFKHQDYESQEDETVLDCLIRHKVNYPCSCQSGVCQSCIAQLTAGKIDPAWQKGLKETQTAKNYFLTCLAKPTHNISFSLPSLDKITSVASIKHIKYFNDNVICLHLLASQSTQWIPGQYVNLINPKGCRRSYSIANIPEEDGYIELHIKLMPNGVMSEWIKTSAHPGCKVHLQGPIGECFYTNPWQKYFPMVLAGTGTGLAPLLAITRDAIRHQHKGKITLIHGGVCAKDLYLDKTLKQFAKQYKQLNYQSCILQADKVHQQASIDQILLQAVQNNNQARVYVCGPEGTTKKLKTTAFLAGIPSAFIYSDVFIDANKKKEYHDSFNMHL